MARLSSGITALKPHYEVIVVGSGYGGGIAASRLARAGRQVCVLERGREFQPGEYPDTLAEAALEMQVDLPECHQGSRTGLYDFHVNPDINVFVGCGLGGTSLVNANVALRAEPRVFDDPCWPQALRDDAQALAEGYRHAEEMLKPTEYPEDYPNLPKLQALEQSAAHIGGKCYRPPINVTFQDGVNHVGVEQHACKLCGDCVSGCNYAAKNTVLMNYLPDACNHGAEIFTQISVRRIERKSGRWLIHYQLLDSGREKFDAPALFVSADLVILAAGTLGTTEILLRSRQAGLPVSDRLGSRFTSNGDVLGFGYNGDRVINGIGFGHRRPDAMEPVGPCITGIIDLRNQPRLEEGMVIEEGSIPGALGSLMPANMAAAAALLGKDTDAGAADQAREAARELESQVFGPYRGAVRNTQTYLVMSHDDGAGSMRLIDDRLRVEWPGVGAQAIFKKVNRRLEECTVALGGTAVPNPTWTELLHHNLVTVHPLGGCIMAEDAQSGVVNHKGQVFCADRGAAVHEGLYVSDGSVIPRSLGVNPLLTISALAERCCALLAQERGWKIDYGLPSSPRGTRAALHTGIQFTETMRGFFSNEVQDDFERAADRGRQAGSAFEFTLTVSSDDLGGMLSDPAHRAIMTGTVSAAALSAQPLTVSNGEFNLFTVDPQRVGTRQMRYRMPMIAADGATYFMEGFKVVRNDPGLDLWKDTTTLYITVYRGAEAKGPVLGKGILRIRPDDFLRQMTTLRVTNAPSAAERLRAVAEFGRFFGGVLFDTYGGVFARQTAFDPDAPPRKRRPLRAPAPEIHWFGTDDGVNLRLTRYRGGARGPVILSHGLGVSSLIFSIDTIETNLLEYLVAHGYDVWLLDFRASIELPAAAAQFSGDDIATRDYPAAVAKVRAVTGAASVQMVVHCFGATTFFMAMLAGLSGVRSAVCSQIATHIVSPPMTQLKAGLHLPTALRALGVASLSAYVDTHADWQARLYDDALRLYPVDADERCTSATCRRISFMYAPLYEHARLNTATHDALHEMFGVANVRAFEHLALLVRTGHLVGADGGEIYLPHLERLKLPIAFIHGAENQCFLPASTERTYRLLCEAHGAGLYARHVVPGYGHIDCIFGKDAARDVFPFVAEHLERTAA